MGIIPFRMSYVLSNFPLPVPSLMTTLWMIGSRGLRIEDIELLIPPERSGLVGAEGYENEGQVKVVRLSRS